MAVVRRALVGSEGTNLYVRIENVKGSLTPFGTRPLWAIAIYSLDVTGPETPPASARGFYGGQLRRPATHMVARWSSADSFAAFQVSAAPTAGWTFTHHISRVPAPRWEPSRGIVEAVVPIQEFMRGSVAIPGALLWLQIGFEYQDPDTGTWFDSDFMQLDHRLA